MKGSGRRRGKKEPNRIKSNKMKELDKERIRNGRVERPSHKTGTLNVDRHTQQ